MPIDYIIVGQGLAGSCVALQLEKRGKKIVLFDEPHKNKASAVAAGLFNPITGKLLKKTWMADELFPYLFEFYRQAEQQLSQKFFFPMPIYRPFLSVEEQNDWAARATEPEIKEYVDQVFFSASFSQVNDPLGGILTRQSGYVDVNAFLKTVANHFAERKSYRPEKFSALDLKIMDESVTYRDIEARGIIFCEGTAALANPYFHWVPVKPLKGETLTISLSDSTEAIFNRGVYLVPTRQEKTFIAGATYQPGNSTEGITLEGRCELEDKLQALLADAFTVDHQEWGIRPTTPDRRPIIGRHPARKNLIVFNGLGTKGVSLAPYFSGVLAQWLDGEAELPWEVNIERFKSLYSKFSFANL